MVLTFFLTPNSFSLFLEFKIIMGRTNRALPSTLLKLFLACLTDWVAFLFLARLTSFLMDGRAGIRAEAAGHSIHPLPTQ